MLLIKKLSIILLLFCGFIRAESNLPNLATNIDEQSLSNPAYILGQYWFRKLNGSRSRIHFPPAYDYLTQALSKLLPYTDLYQKKIEIGLLNSPQSNAFVLPGSHLFIYSNMLSKIDNEETFYALLAHELAHLDLKHYERQSQHNKQEQSKAMLMMGASVLAALAGAQGDASYALLLSGIANKEENRLSYSRIQEQEADRQAKKYLRQADLNEQATSDLFLSFFQSSIGQNQAEFLSTHPIAKTRLADSIETKPTQSVLKQTDQSAFREFRSTMLAYRASLLLNSDNYIATHLTHPKDQIYARALVAYLKSNLAHALALAPYLDERLNNQAYLKAKIYLENNRIDQANRIIQKKLSLNTKQLAYLALQSPPPIETFKQLRQQNQYYQYEEDIINQAYLQQAKADKNLALTRAYEAKIAFSHGKTKTALSLLKRAEPIASNQDVATIQQIKNEILSRVELEGQFNISQE